MLLVLEQASKSYYSYTFKISTKLNFVHLAQVQFWQPTPCIGGVHNNCEPKVHLGIGQVKCA